MAGRAAYEALAARRERYQYLGRPVMAGVASSCPKSSMWRNAARAGEGLARVVFEAGEWRLVGGRAFLALVSGC